ncbi:YqeG family HAD IIIA-type phosphatase [Liquorilactobacillus nagelii]|uniref:YqeG family HAD IIIA-type phosphatase n=1 Tax=Liquorilactobacillus nagelii TaxID=82688 RepID=UPI0039EC68E0
MFTWLKPTWMLESIFDLTPEDLKSQGIKVVLTDLDNTLIAWNQPSGSSRLTTWLKQMESAAIPVIIVSNNSRARIESFAAPLNLPFVARAMKPLGVGVKRAMKVAGINNQEVALIGDQLLTDVMAAHSAGIRSILVKPLVESDAWNTKINRFFEKRLKHYLQKKNLLSKNWGKKLNDR